MSGYDPTWSDTKFLLNFEGSDGSTTTVDSSPAGATVALVGNTAIDYAQKKFGEGSAELDGTGDFIEITTDLDESGPFTIEFFYRLRSYNTFTGVIQLGNQDNINKLQLDVRESGKLNLFAIQSSGNVKIPDNKTAGSVIALNQWYHIKLDHDGDGVYTVSLDGTTVITADAGSPFTTTNDVVRIGTVYISNTIQSMNGHVDAVRCKPELVYIGNFSPPTEPFPETDEPPATNGTITGTVKIDGVAAQRQLIGISYAPQEFDGEDEPRRIVVGETTSAEDGTYTLETPGFVDEVIVLALDNYGEIWRPNRAYLAGQRIRPTRGKETGYGYDITSIGAATAQAKPLWWSVAHAPILPTPSEAPEVLWTPENTTTELWLDFSDRDNYTAVAEAYSLVSDKSGNERDASQGTAANRPTRVTEGQNGLDFARFDGSNDILQLVAFAQASGQHLFIFADTTSLQSGYRASVDRSSGSASNLGALFGASPQNYKPCFYWNGNQRAVQTSAVQRKAGIRWHFTVGSPSMALTQVDADTAVSETFTAAALTNWATIGGPGALPAVDIYEVVMLPGTATTDDINRVWGYGMHKWGLDALLPSDFVYKDAPPIVE